MKHRSVGILIACALLGPLLTHSTQATITVLVQDNFSSTVGSSLNGRTPADANVPGDTWHHVGSQGAGSISTDGSRNVAQESADDGERTLLNGYNTNAKLVIDATFRYSGGGFSGQLYRGAGVGFYTSGAAVNGDGFFTGLALGPASVSDPSLTLKLINNLGATQGGFVSQLAYLGTRTGATDYHDLEYAVSTTTGQILSILLDGDSYSFSTTAFTNSATAYFGFYTSGPTGPEHGFFDFVELTSVPEPSSLLLLAGGGLVLWWWRK